MEYSLYVYGGGEILCKVFNGVALLFKSDNPYFTSVGTLTMGIGLLYIAARAIPQASFSLFFKSWFLPTFLLVALFYGPKASVHIIDKVDNNFEYNKVDNIPVGVAAVASLSTHFSTYLAETVETVFTTSDAQRFSKVGPLFGAKLIHAANTLTIRDPLMRENLKDFTRQCFAWPYVFSNLDPGKKAALETDDMLGFIEANPHPLLGIYWREPNGQASFVDCRACAVKVRQVIPLEIETGLQYLASQMFSGGKDPEGATRRLHQYFGEAWQSLAKGTSDAAHVIQQELMLNSYRSALLDKRDELGLGRYNSDLINLNAERGQAFQNSSFLIKAALSGTNVTILHTIFFAIALMYFTIMAPMTFLPGGMSWVTTWIKVVVWLASWPVLFAVLNCLGYMFAGQATRSCQIGYGEGLTLMTQNGLADAAYTAYCWVMGLQYSVPFVSWALISKASGHAFSQLASSLSQTGESFAGKAGSEIVDGNVSFDSQTLHHRSIANAQIAQQQLGSSFNYGSRFDDGKMTTLYGTGGQVTLQEQQTQLGTNVSQNDALSAMMGVQSQMALQTAYSKQRMASEQFQQGSNELFSLATSMARSTGSTETFGSSEAINAQKSLNNAMSMVSQFGKDHGISEDKAFSIMLDGGVRASAEAGSGFLSGLKGALSLGATGQMQSVGRNSDSITQSLKSDTAKQFAENFNSGLQYMLDNKGSISDSHQRQSLDQMQKHFNQAQSYSEQASSSYNESKMWSQTASMNEQRSLASGSNINDSVLTYVANKRFGGDKVAAATWQSENPSIYQSEVSSYLQQRKATLSNFASSNGLDSAPDIHSNHLENDGRIINAVTNGQLDLLREQNGVGFSKESLDQKIQKNKESSVDQIAQQSRMINQENSGIELKDLGKEFKQKDEEYLIKKAGRKMKNG
ncbi:MAG: conjugal transfer protein TraG N-terminal domain-containing protein [Candidatus Paracaedibacteraceae bacterium]|nr:conjugal transfer protein TraG N-terminal domain-containing protein [Candidatus Paracaedibacteraceae bacterium]